MGIGNSLGGILLKIYKRLYEDYFKKSRLKNYEKLLIAARNNGYKMVSIIDFYNIVSERALDKTDRFLINRHDIDTSPKVAKKMFEIEQKVYGKQGSATYYFRKSTYDIDLIKAIDSYGYEIGYHYEEIATFEKKKKLRSIAAIKNCFPEIKKMFLNNLETFRKETGCKILSIASHGDFVNVKLNYQNNELLKEPDIRKQSGILVEAYDDIIENSSHHRYADQKLLERFTDAVIEDFSRKTSAILLLTHPRNWEVDICANTKDNILRLFEGVLYSK